MLAHVLHVRHHANPGADRDLDQQLFVVLPLDRTQGQRAALDPECDRTLRSPVVPRPAHVAQLALLADAHRDRAPDAVEPEPGVPGQLDDAAGVLAEQDRLLRRGERGACGASEQRGADAPGPSRV